MELNTLPMKCDPPNEHPICEKCALNTLPRKCRSCHKWTGYYRGPATAEGCEHRACKRRRLE